MNQEPTPAAIQLKPDNKATVTSTRPAKKFNIPKRILILVALITVIIVVIIIITLFPTKQKPTIDKNGGLPNISPFPTTESSLPQITDPVLKSVNDKIGQLQNELKNPFNYSELLQLPVIDFAISF